MLESSRSILKVLQPRRLHRRIHPLIIILANLLMPLAVLYRANIALQLYFWIFAGGVLLLGGRYKRFLKSLGITLVLFAILWAIFRYVPDINPFLYLMVLLLLSFMPIFMLASVLVHDYTTPEVLGALQMLKLPRQLVLALTITIRYIPTFKKEFAYIRESLRLRGIHYSIRRPLKSIEYFIVPQLFRCLLLSEELTAAGLTRGIEYAGRRSSYLDMHLRACDFATLAIFLIGTIGVMLYGFSYG